MRKLIYVTSAVLITTLLSLSSWSDAAAGVKASAVCNPRCPSCTLRIGGNWHYYVMNYDLSTRYTGHYTLVQRGYRFNNTDVDETNNIYGTLEYNRLDFTLVVNGEEIEGWVMHCEEHLFGDTSNKIAAVCKDGTGWVGSFTAMKE